MAKNLKENGAYGQTPFNLHDQVLQKTNFASKTAGLQIYSHVQRVCARGNREIRGDKGNLDGGKADIEVSSISSGRIRPRSVKEFVVCI